MTRRLGEGGCIARAWDGGGSTGLGIYEAGAAWGTRYGGEDVAVVESDGGGGSSHARGRHGVEEDGAPDAWDLTVSERRANAGAAGLGYEAGPALLLGRRSLGCAEGKERADAGRQELVAGSGAGPTGRIGREGRKVFSFSFSNFQTNFECKFKSI